MSKRTPKSYRVQDGCWNCRLVFHMYEHDEGGSYFCTKGTRSRPECGSVAMGESFLFDNNRTGWDHAAERRWNRWSKGREVSRAGICDAWEAE